MQQLINLISRERFNAINPSENAVRVYGFAAAILQEFDNSFAMGATFSDVVEEHERSLKDESITVQCMAQTLVRGAEHAKDGAREIMRQAFENTKAILDKAFTGQDVTDDDVTFALAQLYAAQMAGNSAISAMNATAMALGLEFHRDETLLPANIWKSIK